MCVGVFKLCLYFSDLEMHLLLNSVLFNQKASNAKGCHLEEVFQGVGVCE